MVNNWSERVLDWYEDVTNKHSGCCGCLSYIALLTCFFGPIIGCSNYLTYNYYNRVEITRQAITTYALFGPTSATSFDIYEQDALHFLNKTSEPVIICIGTEGDCTSFKANAIGPRALYAPGQKIKPGQLVDVTFQNEGTYIITFNTLPHAHLTVNVKHESSD